MKQNFANHRKYNTLHHFVFFPLTIATVVYGIYQTIQSESSQGIWIFLTLTSVLIALLGIIARSFYGLKNQDRIIRLEMRLRYFQLTNQPFNAIEHQLELGQIFALRFASDDELVDLIKRTIRESLTPTEIKKAIQNWQSDYMRV